MIFSIGFVLEKSPKRQFETICSNAYTEQEIKVTWDRSVMCNGNNGCCGECVSRQLLCIADGNSKRFIFSVFDEKGDEFDISDIEDIVFSVSDGVMMAGGMYAGGTIRFEKKLSTTGITLAGTGYQFIVDISPADLEGLVNRDNYFEATLTTSSGNVYTVKAGILRITKTNVGI